METSQADLERIIAAIKARTFPSSGFAQRGLPQAGGEKRPQKPKSIGGNALAGNTAFLAAMASRKPAVELPTRPLVSRTVYLDKPFLIWQPDVYPPDDPNPGLDQFLDYGIQPYSSWARMYVYAEGRGIHAHLEIYYLWTNENSDNASIDVDAPILVTGYAYGRGSAAFFGGHKTTVYSGLRLELRRWIGWGTDSVTGTSRDQTWYPVVQSSQNAIMANLSATGGWGFGSPQSQYKGFDNEQFNIGATGIGIPPGASMMFTTVVDFIITMEGDTITDQAWIDFGSDGYYLSSPFMKLTVRTFT